ncbi:transcription factor IIF subunit tfg1 [Stygiomarasmius scandens]|uniref:Transcription factor IIF subunit tfg1 n=1 Tax=Marasmiellus scandens TaxID=2682957 RepID=A0ABR1K3K7_9AGAR
MPPKEPSMSLLFHPKKTAKNTIRRPNPTSSPNPTPSTSPRKPVAQSPLQVDDDDDDMKLPDTPFTEYKVMSSALNGWKYDVMKFDSRKSVDISRWQTPVKLNRKDLRRDDPAASGVGQALHPMLGPDGNPVYGADGKPVMVDAEGRPVTDASGSGAKGKGAAAATAANNKKKFQKKTRQVFIVPEETRLLRREEKFPWVMEDASGQEMWIAQLEDLGKAETHAFFMPAANDIFKFVPSHRWYKFQKKLKHDLPTDSLTVEQAYQKNQKRDPSTWLHQRNGKAPSAATAAMFKAEAEGRTVDLGSGSLVHSSSQSYGPGGRKLKAVDSGADGLFGDEEEDSKQKAKEYGGEGDFDEIVFEEEFADDEEQMEVDNDDEEAKELEERLKKEYKNANKTREGYIDESEDEDDSKPMSKQAKAMQKMLRSREGNDVYESDEEENPYASSAEEEEEEEPAPVTNEPAVLQQQTQKPQEPVDVKPVVTAARPPNGNDSGSRATSPTPGLGGHSVVAKRATSPKAPKLKSNNASRASSPLAGASRATSPVAVSPVAQNGLQKKRKAEETPTSPTSPNGNGPPKPKKRKSQPAGAAVATPTGPLEDRLLIEWLKNTPNASTRECIQYFTPYLTDEEKKSKFTALVKEVATLKNGVLVLRNAYRSGSSAPSPGVSG